LEGRKGRNFNFLPLFLGALELLREGLYYWEEGGFPKEFLFPKKTYST